MSRHTDNLNRHRKESQESADDMPKWPPVSIQAIVEPPCIGYQGIATHYRINDMEIIVMAHSVNDLLRVHALLGVTGVFNEKMCSDGVMISQHKVEEEL